LEKSCGADGGLINIGDDRQHLDRENMKKKGRQTKVYGTRYSQAVTHPSTNRARRCLTSVIGREPVLSTWYGRRRLHAVKVASHTSILRNLPIISSFWPTTTTTLLEPP
jgi:hypothetical protein